MKKQLSVLVLYNPAWTHIPTVREFLRGLQRYSRHRVVFAPVRPNSEFESAPWLSEFDVVVLHFSVQLFSDWPSTPLASELRRFKGVKAAFLQDEYERTESTRQALEYLRITLVFTCVPESEREKFYPQHRFSHVTFIRVLAGYVPLDFERRERLALPLSERPTEIGYRGRRLAYWYGSLAMEKWWIGRDVDALCRERGVIADIGWSEAERLYGDDWYRFLGKCVATLGCESGANLIDEQGGARLAVEKYLEVRPDADFEEVRAECLVAFDGTTRMNQISPRVFEAVAMHTALILYEGEYSGVVQPGEHYFALKKDYSNFDDAVRLIRDPASVRAMTDRAFTDIVASRRYGYESLATTFDNGLESLARSYRYQPKALQWSWAPAFDDGSLEFIVLNSELGDRQRAIAQARAGVPSNQLLQSDTCFVTLQQRHSPLRAVRMEYVASSEYVARLPACRISDLQISFRANGATPVSGQLVLLFRGRQTHSQPIQVQSNEMITMTDAIMADEIRVVFAEATSFQQPVVRGNVRRVSAVHFLAPPEPALKRAAKRLWHTLPLPLRLSPWAMRAKAIARTVSARRRPARQITEIEPLLRRR